MKDHSMGIILHCLLPRETYQEGAGIISHAAARAIKLRTNVVCVPSQRSKPVRAKEVKPINEPIITMG